MIESEIPIRFYTRAMRLLSARWDKSLGAYRAKFYFLDKSASDDALPMSPDALCSVDVHGDSVEFVAAQIPQANIEFRLTRGE